MVVAVLMTNCQVSLNPKIWPGPRPHNNNNDCKAKSGGMPGESNRGAGKAPEHASDGGAHVSLRHPFLLKRLHALPCA